MVPLDAGCSEKLETRIMVDCSDICGGYSRDGGKQIFWEENSVSEDQKVEGQLGVYKGKALFAAFRVQYCAKTIRRGETPVEEWTDAQRGAAFPTTQQLLEGIIQGVTGQFKWQQG